MEKYDGGYSYVKERLICIRRILICNAGKYFYVLRDIHIANLRVSKFLLNVLA